MPEPGTELITPEEMPKAQLPSLPEKQSDALLVMIQGAIQHPNIDTNVIEKLWEMQKESQDRDAKAFFAKAKAKAQKNMPASIVANKFNDQTKSKYSNLGAVLVEVVPVYSKAGFSMSFNTGPSDLPEHIKITGVLLHEGGHSEDYMIDLPLDGTGIAGKVNKTPVHARSSTISYGQRYLTCLIWNVATGADDDANVSPPKQQIKYYPDQSFKVNLPKWENWVNTGGGSWASVREKIASTGELTEDQERQINEREENV